MFAFPQEIIICILNFVLDSHHTLYSSPHPELVSFTRANRAELQTWSLTCRSFSALARLCIFQQVTLNHLRRAQVLRNLFLQDPALPSLIRTLTIGCPAGASYVKRATEFLVWLDSSEGAGMLGQMSGVTTLRIVDLSNEFLLGNPGSDPQLSLDPGVRIREGERDRANYMAAVRDVWKSIARLQAVTSLVLEKCLLPIREDLFDWLMALYPRLDTLRLRNISPLKDTSETFGALSSSSDPIELPATIVRLVCGPTNVKNIFTGILGRLRCGNLAELDVSATTKSYFSYDLRRSFGDVQFLVSNAPNLQKLVLRDCSYHFDTYPSVNLGMNERLTHLVFHCDSMMENTTGWLADVINTLPGISGQSLLQYLEVVGDEFEEYACRSQWEFLDPVLSSPRFTCSSGRFRRMLKLRRKTSRRVRCETRILSTADTLRAMEVCFGKTRQQGWDIVMPYEVVN